MTLGRAAAYGFAAGVTAPFVWTATCVVRSPYARRVVLMKVRRIRHTV